MIPVPQQTSRAPALPAELLTRFAQDGFIPCDGGTADAQCDQILRQALDRAAVECADPTLVRARLDTVLATRLRPQRSYPRGYPAGTPKPDGG